MANTEQQTLPNGSRIGVYEIRGVDVSSDFSIVYRGWNYHVNAKVTIEEFFPRQFAIRTADTQAVKPLSNESREDFDAGLSSFIEQSKALLAIEHPNIVTVDNLLEANGTAYLVTNYAIELPLARLCVNRQTAFDEEQLRVIFLPILSALQQLHERGFIHGAATPGNILLKKDGEPVLNNFAIARLALAPRTDTLSDFISAVYAPPEYDGIRDELGPWSDIYTLGATMYHCVSGRTPDPARDRIAAQSRNAPDSLQPLTGTPPVNYSEALCATIDSMLALKASDRPQSANAVLTLLEQATEASPVDRTREIGDIPAPSASDRGKNKRLVIGVGAGLAAICLLAIGFWFQKPEERGPDSSAVKDMSPVIAVEEQLQTAPKPESRETGERREQGAEERLALAPPEAQTDYPSAEDEQDVSRETTGTVPARDATPPETEQEPEEPSPDQYEPKLPQPGHEEDKNVAIDKDADRSAAATSDASRTDKKSGTSMPVVEPVEPPSPVPANGAERDLPNTASAEAAGTQTTSDAAGMSELDRSGIIAEHIAAAEEHLNAERLTTPAEGNALAHYRAILEIEPEHADGRMGLERILNHYGWLIEKAVDEDRLRHARIYLTRAGSVIPGAPALEEFQAMIKNAEAVEKSE